MAKDVLDREEQACVQATAWQRGCSPDGQNVNLSTSVDKTPIESIV